MVEVLTTTTMSSTTAPSSPTHHDDPETLLSANNRVRLAVKATLKEYGCEDVHELGPNPLFCALCFRRLQTGLSQKPVSTTESCTHRPLYHAKCLQETAGSPCLYCREDIRAAGEAGEEGLEGPNAEANLRHSRLMDSALWYAYSSTLIRHMQAIM